MERSNMLPPERLVLASASPRRRELVNLLGLREPVEVVSSDADESVPDEWTPEQIVQQLALRKARAVRQTWMDSRTSGQGTGSAVVLGADTIVVLDGEVLGKPRDAAHAMDMLSRLQGRGHEVYTGVALVGTDGYEATASAMTRVYMKSLDSSRIERYVASGEPMDKAGAYGIQGLASAFVDRIDGCYFNVVGLPVSLVSDMLRRIGMDVG